VLRVAESIDVVLIATLILTLAHMFGPNIRRLLRRNGHLVSSFGGGIAVAYVFLQLFPEIEHVHHHLGDRIHLITLASFLIFFAIELRILSQSPAEQEGTRANSEARIFWLHIAVSWLYTAMVIFALPSDATENTGSVVVGSLAIGLHLIYKDYVLRTHHARDFEEAGRYLLALAPLFGWFIRSITTPSDAVFDLFVAVLAGFLMQNVFRDELPHQENARLSWLFSGAALYTLLVFFTE
jgi:hypothetical protein